MLKKTRHLVHIIEKHHEVPAVYTKKRHLGIILTLVGFLLYAFYTVLFQIEAFRNRTGNCLASYFTEFTIFYFAMAISYLPFCLARGKKFFTCGKPNLIILRSILSLIVLWFFSLSRVWTKNVDNSMLYSTDAFWVVAIMLLLKLKINKIAIAGTLIGFFGILFVFFFDIQSWHDIIGGLFGTVSGISLGVIIILQRYMIHFDPPIRVGFYGALIGLGISFLAAILFSSIQGWKIPNQSEVILMLASGFLFSLTLFCFLEAFYYAESFIIGAVSYFFPVFVETISWLITQEPVPWTTIVGSMVLVLGGLIVITSTHFHDKKIDRSHYRF